MDKFRFLICLLTMCVGVIFGLLLSGVNLNSLSGWKEVLELFSYIATISMAIFAIWTLDAWKAQFGFGKRFEALKELGDSFEDLRVILKHIEHMENYYFRKATGESDDELAMLLSDLEQTGKSGTHLLLDTPRLGGAACYLSLRMSLCPFRFPL